MVDMDERIFVFHVNGVLQVSAAVASGCADARVSVRMLPAPYSLALLL
jgi:hypothetical protein